MDFSIRGGKSFSPSTARNYDKARRVLGRGVHPYALARLFEMYPDATVSVRHEHWPIELPAGTRRMASGYISHYYEQPEYETRVMIEVDGTGRPGTGNMAIGKATCHPLDNFDRRKGIKLAFDRALDRARLRHDPLRWAQARRANKKKGAK